MMLPLVLWALGGMLFGLGLGWMLRWRWATPPVCARPHVVAWDSALGAQARIEVRREEADGGNGELKRGRAYARLRRHFPDSAPREISRAIEHALMLEFPEA